MNQEPSNPKSEDEPTPPPQPPDDTGQDKTPPDGDDSSPHHERDEQPSTPDQPDGDAPDTSAHAEECSDGDAPAPDPDDPASPASGKDTSAPLYDVAADPPHRQPDEPAPPTPIADPPPTSTAAPSWRDDPKAHAWAVGKSGLQKAAADLAMDPPVARFEWAGLAACFIAGAWIRFTNVAGRPLWTDEFTTIITATRRGLWESFFTQQDPQPPLYQLWLRFLMVFTGDQPSEWVVRSPALICGCLCVLAAWWFARVLFGPLMAMLCGVGIAINPMMIYYSREARPYTLVHAPGHPVDDVLLSAAQDREAHPPDRVRDRHRADVP